MAVPVEPHAGLPWRGAELDIIVDDDEIDEARWFTRDEITELTASGDLMLPPNVSISRWLLQKWHGGVSHGKWP